MQETPYRYTLFVAFVFNPLQHYLLINNINDNHLISR